MMHALHYPSVYHTTTSRVFNKTSDTAREIAIANHLVHPDLGLFASVVREHDANGILALFSFNLCREKNQTHGRTCNLHRLQTGLDCLRSIQPHKHIDSKPKATIVKRG